MGELARRINYSKSYVSQVENDLRPPSSALAKLCDNALDAGGTLIALARSAGEPVVADEATDDGVWTMSFEENGILRFHQLDRRKMLTGAGALLGFALVRGTRPETDENVVADLRAAFDHVRQVGLRTSPVVVLSMVIPQVQALRTLARDNPEPIRSELLRLASRAAEFTGWMSQEAGDDRAAMWWTSRAVEYAEAGQDRQLASYALVREALIALYQQDAISTIDLARRAQSGDASLRILGLAARREAQGLALAGERDACERALDRATELLAVADARDALDPVLGPSSVDDQAALARGWALCDLGQVKESAELLDRQMVRMPTTARRTRARFGARRALAHAYNGEIDQACVVLSDVLDDAVHVDSATVRVDLRELARTLARWRTHGAVRDIQPELIKALKVPR
jgi:Helix-turn-helix